MNTKIILIFFIFIGLTDYTHSQTNDSKDSFFKNVKFWTISCHSIAKQWIDCKKYPDINNSFNLDSLKKRNYEIDKYQIVKDTLVIELKGLNSKNFISLRYHPISNYKIRLYVTLNIDNQLIKLQGLISNNQIEYSYGDSIKDSKNRKKGFTIEWDDNN